MSSRVFIDANVLRSRVLIDWLYHFRKYTVATIELETSLDVIHEALYTLRRDQPMASDLIIRRRLKLIKFLVDEIISKSFPSNLQSFTGTDVHDYHVHAAAIHSAADFILTANKPTDITTTPGDQPYRIVHPDDFFCAIAEMDPSAFASALSAQYHYWLSREAEPLLADALRKAGCPQFAALVEKNTRLS
ncbi:MAG: hypothetical protein WBH82_06730 [Arcanobacterium sp.]